MHITIFGANSHTGRALVARVLAHGMRVTAFDRQIDHFIDLDNRSDELVARKGYVFDEKDIRKALKDADAVVSLIEGGKDGTDRTRSLGTRNIVGQMEKAGMQRLIALAGTPILDSNEEDHRYLMDEPDFPQEQMPLAQEYLAMLQLLENTQMEWTLVCPPTITDDEGQGSYITSADHLPSPNKERVAAGDLADCILRELIAPQYVRQRVGISGL